MERLTKRVDGIAVLESWAVGKDPVSVIQRLCSALAAHEDTGLEPVEIIGLKNTCEQLNGINDSLFKANQEMGKDLAEWKKPVTRAGWWFWMNLCGLSCGVTKSMIPFFAHDAYVTLWEDLNLLRLAKLLFFNAHIADSQLKVTKP